MSLVTVLLIDDNLVQMRIRKALLTRSGFAVRTAANPEEAFAFLRSMGPDLIITDHTNA